MPSALRTKIADHLQTQWQQCMAVVDDEVVRRTKADAYLLHAWRAAAGHPGDQPGRWLKDGAPIGILNAL